MPKFTETVEGLERDTLSELQTVVKQLDGAVEAALHEDARAQREAQHAEDAVGHRYRLLHERILSALVTHRTPADLQMLAALLHILRGLDRIELHRIKIMRLAAPAAPPGSEPAALLELVETAAALSISGVWLAREAFAGRDVELAHEVVRVDLELGRRSGVILRRALELAELNALHDWSMSMFLVASNAERIGNAAVDVAEQTVIVVNGLFRELADAAPDPREAAATW